MSDTQLEDYLKNFFLSADIRYITTLENIMISSGTKQIYNLPQCLNLVASNILNNIVNDYNYFFDTFTTTYGVLRGTQWKTWMIEDITPYIAIIVQTLTETEILPSIWDSIFADMPEDNDR